MDITTNDNLIRVLIEEYDIEPDIISKAAWGYTSTAYYVKSKDRREYIVKVTLFSEDKLKGAEKDVYFSNLLKDTIPTPDYVTNTDNNLLVVVNDLIFKVAKYVSGTSPFDMNIEILEQLIKFLFKIHQVPTNKVELDIKRIEEAQVLLHGDLTPSNIVVADNEIQNILDFEDVLLGPVEYDLARTAVFCWYRMSATPIQDIFDLVINKYQGRVSPEKVYKYAVLHAQNHLDQVVKNKGNYDDDVFWNDDFNFSKRALEEISNITI